jgi:hypothetical protein
VRHVSEVVAVSVFDIIIFSAVVVALVFAALWPSRKRGPTRIVPNTAGPFGEVARPTYSRRHGWSCCGAHSHIGGSPMLPLLRALFSGELDIEEYRKRAEYTPLNVSRCGGCGTLTNVDPPELWAQVEREDARR